MAKTSARFPAAAPAPRTCRTWAIVAASNGGSPGPERSGVRSTFARILRNRVTRGVRRPRAITRDAAILPKVGIAAKTFVACCRVENAGRIVTTLRACVRRRREADAVVAHWLGRMTATLMVVMAPIARLVTAFTFPENE